MKQTCYDESTLNEGQMKDGMDMSLVAINTKTKLIQFAGANNPLYIIKNQNHSIPQDPEEKHHLVNPCRAIPQAPEEKHHLVNPCRGMDQQMRVFKEEQDHLSLLVEIKGDKQPVSIHIKMQPFTNHEIQLEEGDQIYLFTDGFPDQFGGPKGKKFMYKRFETNIQISRISRVLIEN